MTKKKVALLVGGWSVERMVSLEKGKAVAEALHAGGYDVMVIDVKKDVGALVEALQVFRPDAVFNNLHGRGGEDGEIQSVLEILELPYTHSGVLASAIGMNKPAAKTMAESVGVPVADSQIFTKEEFLNSDLMEPPYVVKPVNEGSSAGVKIVMRKEDCPSVTPDNWPFGEEIMVERYVPGRELTVAVLDGKAQAVTEIVPKGGFFDYAAKYQDEGTAYVLPAAIPEDIYNKALDYAARVYNVIGCAGLARCDFRYNDTDEGMPGLCFLEINTQPGLTAGSIGPSQVVYNGMSFVELCSHLVETAKCHGLEQQKPQQQDAAVPADSKTV